MKRRSGRDGGEARHGVADGRAPEGGPPDTGRERARRLARAALRMSTGYYHRAPAIDAMARRLQDSGDLHAA